MDTTAAAGAALPLIGILIWYLVRARSRRPVDPYREAMRDLAESGAAGEPIAPADDPQDTVDRAVDRVSAVFTLVSVVASVLIVGLVVYFAFVDTATRIVVLSTLAVMAVITVLWRRLSRPY